MKLPDNLQGRLCHTTALFHCSPTQKQLVNFGGVEENDKPPMAETLVMDLSKCNIHVHVYMYMYMYIDSGKTLDGRWIMTNSRKPDPKTLGINCKYMFY